jgi:hypothetical protein
LRLLAGRFAGGGSLVLGASAACLITAGAIREAGVKRGRPEAATWRRLSRFVMDVAAS